MIGNYRYFILAELRLKAFPYVSYALHSILLWLLLLLLLIFLHRLLLRDDIRLHLHIHIHVQILLVRNEALPCHFHLHFVHLVLFYLVNLLFGDHRDRGGCCWWLIFLQLHLISKLGDHHFALPAMI